MAVAHTTRFLLVSVLCAACGHAPAPASPSTPTPWPVPDGWRAEAFAFPLDFAPGIAHRGREELRFPPGFMDAKSPNFWSYAFVWRLDEDDRAAIDAASLSADLVAYFDGLAAAVDADTHKLPATRTPATAILRTDLTGDLTIWDAFTTGAQVTLHLRTNVMVCLHGQAVIFELSPAPTTRAIWRELDTLALHYACVQITPRE